MGAKKFHSYIKKNAPSAIKRVSLDNYKGKTVIIDVSNFLYKYLYSQGSRYLIGFILFYSTLVKHGIDPVFCFDGKPPIEKKQIIERRRKVRNKKELMVEQLKIVRHQIIFSLENNSHEYNQSQLEQIDEEIEINSRKCVRITSSIIDNLKKLFDIMGVKYVQAKDQIEADHLIGLMIRHKKGFACISNDVDPLLHGSRRLLYDFNHKANVVLEYNFPEIMKTQKMSFRQLIILSILLGSDYISRVKHVPTIELIELSKKHHTLKGISDELAEKGHTYLKNHLSEYINAFKMHYELVPLETVIDSSNFNIEKTNQLKDGLIKFDNQTINNIRDFLKENVEKPNIKIVRKYCKNIMKHLHYTNSINIKNKDSKQT